ncbi:MAG: hypothetical protein OXG78_17200 [Chloroflexi bacterium]|nr:hypothetical protein [Chloroflexota bacterium]
MRPLLSVLLASALTGLTGCNINRPDQVPAPTDIVEVLATTQAPPSATPSPQSPTADVSLEIATLAPTDTATPITPEASPIATSPYFEYFVNEGETMYYILQLPEHGYGYEPNVAATVVALNANIPNADSVRGGITILIPRPTLTPTPLGAEATQEFLATIGADDTSGVVLPAGATIGCHIVEAGDAIIGVAVQNNTTLEILHGLNRDLNWFGCNFTLPSGGENCAPNLSIGQCIRVPLPTPLPTKFPTPTGNETATPTATKLAPRLLYPADGAIVPHEPLLIQWVGIAGLHDSDEYLIELVDQTINQPLRQVTRTNSFLVPSAFMPGDGQTHLIQWRVSVARPDAQGVYNYVGAEGDWRTFEWKSS